MKESIDTLIVNITEICDFACTFCSAIKISDEHAAMLDINYIYKFLERFPNTSTIIVLGGDPLMVKPHYYWKLIEHLEQNNYKATISFTTNLWNFYNNPNKWTDLFNHERIRINTSFNYGNTRRIKPHWVYTEELFWKVSNLFLEKIGYRPDFISVINDDNKDSAIDNVWLAKEMDVDCKLNPATSSGREKNPFLLANMYEIYLKIDKLGLSNWEFNTREMKKGITGTTICPLLRNCDNHIRTINPQGEYYSCDKFAHDRSEQAKISFDKEINGDFYTPLQDSYKLNSLKYECLTCSLFKLCNGCRKNIQELKNHNLVETHCSKMKSMQAEIEKLNGQ